MKKTLSLILALTLLFSLLTLPASSAIRENIFTVDRAFPYDHIGLNPTTAYVPEHICDGNTVYFSENAGTFCDHRLSASQREVQKGTATLYNLAGATDAPDSKYLCVLFFELDQTYLMDGFSFFCSNAVDGIPSNLNVDGFDIFLNETGQTEDWKAVYSGTELHCGKKYQVQTAENGLQTAYITADFEPARGRYIAFALSQPRCQHADALKAAYHLEISEHPEYFRITEIEFYGTAADAEVTVTPEEPETAPVTTAPTEISLATLNYEAILVTVLLIGMAAAALIFVKLGKKKS